jgi:hypothetical protein
MAIMKRHSLAAVCAAIALYGITQPLLATSGFATRELNPMLQPIYLPSLVPVNTENGWRVDHSLFITNDLQETDRGSERLIIDAENYRYELDVSHRRNHWLTHITIPLMATRGGELDSTIETWHDLFGLPNGDRGKFPQDKVNIQYERDGIVEYSQTESSSGIGDIALAIGYQPTGKPAYFAGIELPTGSESDFTGNEAIDFAFWISHEAGVSANTNAYGMLGISFPADDGQLEGLVRDEVWVAQLGFDYRFSNDYIGTVQLDMHGETIKNSDLDAFGESFQLLLALGFPTLLENHRLDLFFTEDVHVNSAPDITFGLRLSREY